MSDADSEQYSKLRWLLTAAGLVLYVGDMWTDIGVGLKYFQEEQYVWSGLTLMFVLSGLFVTQIFSCVWYWEDMNDPLLNPEGKLTILGLSKRGLAVLHVFGMGIFTRYYDLLTKGYRFVWSRSDSCKTEKMGHKLFCMAADLSMLKLFESFLESVPQLLLQLYVLLSHDEFSCIQYLSVTFSFFNASWALVDYRRCLRRSLPHVKEMPSGFPTAVYLLYKLCSITSHLLSYSFLLILSLYTTVGLTVIWLGATIWTHLIPTNFCSSRLLELLYRAVTGVIFIFTFFNVKGQDTKIPMTIYYIFYCVVNAASLVLVVFLKPELLLSTFALVSCGLIIGSTLLGMLCLVSYYLCLHEGGYKLEEDEMDGPVLKVSNKSSNVFSTRVKILYTL
ncbi:XK-related protein 9 [Mugil cephalus]|uniref:XK-related protein 9 n=1 Tax=Mugil cephalus TaxID=48193 RepID=UPI001FB8203B|nr:XK-related protein 9 [Mugil cephalus]XP_047424371.1 XK-related protein 9 [Mugil cephalus]